MDAKEEEEEEETEGIKIIDARNGFNKLSHLEMLWMVRHFWLSGMIFSLNCYCHEALAVVHRPAALCNIMTSREGVTQVDPLSMILYGLALLLLDEFMRAAYPGVPQP